MRQDTLLTQRAPSTFSTTTARLLGCAPVFNSYAVEVGDIVVECTDLFSPKMHLYLGTLLSTHGEGIDRIVRIRSLYDGKVRKIRNPYLKAIVRKQFASIALGEVTLD